MTVSLTAAMLKMFTWNQSLLSIHTPSVFAFVFGGTCLILFIAVSGSVLTLIYFGPCSTPVLLQKHLKVKLFLKGSLHKVTL